MGDEDFESKYLSSGIDLNINKSNNSSKKLEQSQAHQRLPDSQPTQSTFILDDKTINIIPELQAGLDDDNKTSPEHSAPPLAAHLIDSKESPPPDEHLPIKSSLISADLTPDLTRIAVRHLDQYQWQLPLLEMDARFRDRTYYKHYSDYYISSLRSKLGHFLADSEMLMNPMRHHVRQELDNYKRYSKMFNLLTEYYRSLGSNFFSFATPSPDEEIVIGCRLGTKGYYHEMSFVVHVLLLLLLNLQSNSLTSHLDYDQLTNIITLI